MSMITRWIVLLTAITLTQSLGSDAAAEPSRGHLSVHTVSIGEREQSVTSKFGHPEETRFDHGRKNCRYNLEQAGTVVWVVFVRNCVVEVNGDTLELNGKVIAGIDTTREIIHKILGLPTKVEKSSPQHDGEPKSFDFYSMLHLTVSYNKSGEAEAFSLKK